MSFDIAKCAASTVELIPLSDIANIVGGYAFKGADFGSCGVPVVKIANIEPPRVNIQSCEKVPEEKLSGLDRFRLYKGDVLMAMTGATVGKVGRIRDHQAAYLNQRVAKIYSKIAPEYDDFIFALLSQKGFEEEILNNSSGSAQANVSADGIGKVLIPVLEPRNQLKIGKFVAAIDDKIDLSRRINQTLEAMAQAIFKSWFVDFDPVKAKIAAKQEGCAPLRAAMSAISGKPDAELDALPPEQYAQLAATAALFPDEMEESELGKIPKGWSASKVETLLARLSAKTRYTKEQVSEYGQIPVFEQGASILLGYHNGTASYQASAESPMFIFGDHTCVTRLSCQLFDISQNVIPLQGQDRATAWVYYAVKEKQKFQEYRRHWMELISKDVVVAAADTCLEFSKRVSSFHLQMETNERQMQGLRELRDTLLPKLLSGELSVTEAIAEVEA